MLIEGRVLGGTSLKVVGWAACSWLYAQERYQQLLGRSAACKEVGLYPTLGAGEEGTLGHVV